MQGEREMGEMSEEYAKPCFMLNGRILGYFYSSICIFSSCFNMFHK